MFKQQNYLAIGAVVIVVVLLLSLPTRVTGRLKAAVGSWFLPLFGLASASQKLPADLADSVLPRRELLKQIDTLRREKQELLSRSIQSAAIARENEQLRAMFGRARQLPWRLKMANVIGREPANWWRTVWIDRGSQDGLTNNQPVLSAEGCLVGRIASVRYYDSEVVLIGDPNCRVSATVENAARDMGVLTASGPLDTSLVELTYLSSSANVKPGQSVISSGLGGVFPKGIPIGQIVDSRSVEYGLYTEARVRLSANLGSLEQVWVLFP
jgi:rod shape-determining protein MreC